MEKKSEQTLSSLTICGGCGSSGTTLLAHLISRHPQIASGPEFNCFNHPELYDISKLRAAAAKLVEGTATPAGYVDVRVFMTSRDHYGITNDLITSWVNHSDDSAVFVGDLVDHLLRRFESKFFFEKTPTNAYFFSMAGRYLPGVKLVHVLRDGRDVVCSLMRRGWNLFGAGSRWLYDTIRGLEGRTTSAYLELRYEDLVTRPSEAIDSLLEHVGADGSSALILRPTSKSRGLYTENWVDRDEPKVWHQTPADPISAKSIGNYKTVLSQRDLDTLYRIRRLASAGCRSDLPKSFGELQELLGYDTPKNSRISPRDVVRDLLYQFDDYKRRFSRHASAGWGPLPKIFTRLG